MRRCSARSAPGCALKWNAEPRSPLVAPAGRALGHASRCTPQLPPRVGEWPVHGNSWFFAPEGLVAVAVARASRDSFGIVWSGVWIVAATTEEILNFNACIQYQTRSENATV